MTIYWYLFYVLILNSAMYYYLGKYSEMYRTTASEVYELLTET